jgi:uncharacterized protein
MEITVRLYEDAASLLAAAGEFLRSEPVLHNLVLTLLDSRLNRHEPGRYWVASQTGQVAGVVFQSPLKNSALLVPMEPAAITALVDAIAASGVALPGVFGDAATAATFAGRWTDQSKAAAFPVLGLRLYELAELKTIGPVEGRLRQATATDRNLALALLDAFSAEIDEPQSDLERTVDEWLASEQIWLWQNGDATTIAVSRKPVQGVVRVTSVYTPPANRRRGYAAACVYGLSRHFTEAGYRCVLYTDLGNPVSNSVYRRIGYKVVAEATRYRFDPR